MPRLEPDTYPRNQLIEWAITWLLNIQVTITPLALQQFLLSHGHTYHRFEYLENYLKVREHGDLYE